MDIQPVTSKWFEKPEPRPVKPAPAKNNTPVDRVEISRDYDNRLERVRQRIRSGFYTSQEVRADLSEKLSKVLDDLTG